MPTDTTRCPLCGQSNACAMTAGLPAGECWCMEQPVSRKALARIPPEERGRACLCPRCAADMIPDQPTQEPPCPPTTSK